MLEPAPQVLQPAVCFRHVSIGSAEPRHQVLVLLAWRGVGQSPAIPSAALPIIEHMFVDRARGPTSGEEPGLPKGGPSEVPERPLSEVEREICELAAHIAAATCRWLTLAAEFDRRRGHELFGFASCASWLAWRCSLTPRAAREQLRVARALRELPRIRAAFARGSLSYSKVRALTRVAEPEMEGELLELAEDATAAQLERLLRGYRGAIAADAAEQTLSRRHLTTRWEDDGTLTIRGNLPPDEAALFLRGLERARQEVWKDAAEPPDRADALVALAESAVANGIESASGGDRNQIVVHVDVGELVSRNPGAGATLDEGVSLPAETARRLGCDAAIVSLVERDGEPLSVGRKTRSIPPALARALRSRDRGCRFPGCDHDRFVDAHHVEHWAHGGETSLDNLMLLCRRHHRLVHEGGFAVTRERDELVFRTPTGTRMEAAPSLPAGTAGGCAGAVGARVDAETIASNRGGEPIDYDVGVFALAGRRERRVATPAGPAHSVA
jgi:hypothetical protein